MSEVLERLPPQNLEAEQSVLGAMLLDSEAIIKAGELLEPEDFYREAHQVIFRSILDLSEKMEAVDLVTLGEELRQKGNLEPVGGLTYLTSLVNSVPSAANVESYARIVQEKSMMRQLLSSATSIIRTVYDGGEEPEVVLDSAERLIFEIGQSTKVSPYVRLREVLGPAFDRVEYLYTHQGTVIGVPSGFRGLDERTSGFHPSELIVLAARPSMGKTTLSLNIAAHVALEGQGVGLFSLEMSREQLAMRLLCAEAGINSHRIRTGNLRDSDWPRLSHAMGRLSEAPIFIDDTPNLSIMEMRARARRMKAEHDIVLMVVDYLQLMHTRGRTENRQQEISEISRSLKALARELQVPVIACSQLSRAVEQREGRRPQLSDLRESGAIEQDADVVAFIHQDPKAEGENLVELLLAKQRNGPTGSIPLVFLKDVGRFTEPAWHSEQDVPPDVGDDTSEV